MRSVSYILSFVCLIILQNISGARLDSAKIVFADTEFDFGQIYETDGSVHIEFEYKNSGKQPLIINRIIAPGLTIEKYNRDYLNAGDSAKLQIVLNPFNNPGYFNKKIEVFTNAINSPAFLTVKGTILNGSNSNVFKYIIGPVAFRQSQLNFGYLFKNNDAVYFVALKNNSDNPIKLKFENVPSHLAFKPLFESLAAQQIGLVEVKYITTFPDDWDFIIDQIKIIVLGTTKSEGTLTVSANLREDFSKLTPQDKISAPIASIQQNFSNFDTIKQGEIINHSFVLKNTGSRDLILRSVKTTCGCAAVFPEKNLIHPGDSTTIKVSFNSEGFFGDTKKGITIITNDPVDYKQFLWINGYVK